MPVPGPAPCLDRRLDTWCSGVAFVNLHHLKL